MKSILFCILLLLSLFSCNSEPKDCRTLIIGEWTLSSHKVDPDVFRNQFSKDLIATDTLVINPDEIQKRIVDNFVQSNSAIQFTPEGKYLHTDLDTETTYGLEADCKAMTFEMSPGFIDTLQVTEITEKKLALEYKGITMEYKRVKEEK